jgi:hypothetical protein
MRRLLQAARPEPEVPGRAPVSPAVLPAVRRVSRSAYLQR